MSILSYYPNIKERESDSTEALDQENHRIIVFNDDHNTFDWVIESLVALCKHTTEQAEQCAMIIHNRGKCDVKKGDFDTLRPMAEGLIDRGINATIE